ncbi:hypothetical protein ACH5RR_002017 [Cinchona calisaya]|uniref:KIB1-4 beta-propeller domain-containing protein n=1 Tax=Cinchona calisaya TaxID=153742 RepID=A0ABD3B5B6_9GENT
MDSASRDQVQEEEHKSGTWSDLPMDILCLIKYHLFAADSAAFSAVCKTWKSVPAVVRSLALPPDNNDNPLSNCPCLMFLNNRFYHPVYNASFQLDNILRLPEGIIRVSKYGWLLMTQGDQCPFFFNPFTNVRIDLPRIDYKVSSVTFTNPPTSNDCEIVGFSTVDDVIRVYSIKRGKESWTEHEFKNRFCVVLSRCNPVLHGWRYYCLGTKGNLVVYDPKKNTVHRTGSPNHIWAHFEDSDCRHYMLESEGDIFAVFVACSGRHICICRLNLSKMVWEMAEDLLEDKMLFVSRPASFLKKALVRGTGNKIYFPRFHGDNGLFYSLATKRYHTFGGGSCYESFHNSKERLYCTWMKPSQLLQFDREVVFYLDETCMEKKFLW